MRLFGRSEPLGRATAVLLAATLSVFSGACASSGPAPEAEPSALAAAPVPPAMDHDLPATDGPGFTAADVRFMQGMIAHHAQAITMAAMAPSHGAGERLLKLAQKIDISQKDEIKMMERWLAERRQAVPDPMHLHMMMMPGMVSPEQVAELERARGADFDRLFLRFMIQHHQGALAMVESLLQSPGAAQDSDIFRFVTDVQMDQSAEIDAMASMLEAYPGSDSR